MKFRYLVIIMTLIMSSLGLARKTSIITIEYADGTQISGEKYIDRAGHLHVVTEGGEKLY